MSIAAKRAAFFLLILAGWEFLYQLRLWPHYLFPSPFHVIESLIDGFRDHGYARGALSSLRRMGIGYGVSVVAGLLIGILFAWRKTLEETAGTVVVGLQALPSICWLPLAILWFGLNERAILFVVVMGSLLCVTLATTSGIRRVQPIVVRAARTMGARGWRLYVYVTIPAALPSIMDGLKQGWAFAWRSLMAGELLFVTQGLGHHLAMGRELNDMSQVLAVMLLIIGLGLAVDRGIFEVVERRIRERWGYAQA